MITIIACVDNSWGIGKDNDLLVNIPQDMKHFKNETTGNVCVFGRKTAESLPDSKPLPNRRNILLTRDRLNNSLAGFETMESIDEVLSLAKEEDVYICGGAEVYELFLPHANRVVLTALSETYESDTKFPHMAMHDWYVAKSKTGLSIRNIDMGEHEGVNYTIFEYLEWDTKEDNK